MVITGRQSFRGGGAGLNRTGIGMSGPEGEHGKGETPRRRRKEARPGEIIIAGLGEFAENGFAGARLEDVARRAGIAKGTIYRYFDDKEALFLATMETFAASAFDDLEMFANTSDLPTKQLLKMIILKAHELLTTGDLPILMGIVIREGAKFPQLTEMYHTQGVGRGRQLLGKIIQRGIERGDLKQNAATRLPIVLLAPAIMTSLWNMTFQKLEPIGSDAFLAAHIDLVFEGIWQEKDLKQG